MVIDLTNVNIDYLPKVEKDFYYYITGSGKDSSFGAKLWNLIIKADLTNRTKLAKGFPEEVYVVNSYNFVKNYSKHLEKEYS